MPKIKWDKKDFITRLLVDKYNIADNIFFNDEGTQGGGAYARIAQILGPEVTNITYNTKKLSNIQFTPT